MNIKQFLAEMVEKLTIRDKIITAIAMVLLMLLMFASVVVLAAPEVELEHQVFSSTITNIDAIPTDYTNEFKFIAGVVSNEYTGPILLTPEQYAYLKSDDTVTVHIIKTSEETVAYIEEYNPENVQFPFIR